MKTFLFMAAALLLFAAQPLLCITEPAGLSGVVLDSASGTPLAGASVMIQETQKGRITKGDGTFIFEDVVSGTYTVLIRYVGYRDFKTQVIVDHERFLSVRLVSAMIQTGEVVVEKERAQTGLSTQQTIILTPAEVDEHRGQTFSELLKDVPGVTLLQTGPSISKPVIRGMHSQRILILNNDTRLEGQQWGQEHAPEIDPFAVSSVEVLKGAASVQYGADAIGGVIRTEHRAINLGGFEGEFSANLFSNNMQGSASLLAESGFLENFSWRLQGSMRKAGDAQTSNYMLANTAFEELNGLAMLGFKNAEREISATVSHFGTRLGVFSGSHIKNLSDLERAFQSERPLVEREFSYQIGLPKQDIGHTTASLRLNERFKNSSVLTLNAAWQQNRRQEFDAHRPYSDSLAAQLEDRPAYDLSLTTYTLDGTYEHVPFKNISGKAGVSLLRQGNVSQGRSLFVPNYRVYSGGAFVLEQWTQDNFIINAGARYDWRGLTSYRVIDNAIVARDHIFQSFSGALGALYSWAEGWLAGVNLGTGWRPPSINELYANGVHHGTASFEIGDTELRSERSVNLDVTLRFTGERLRLDISTYIMSMPNYIVLFPEAEPTLTIRGAFPTFRYRQTEALIRGFEAQADYQLNHLLRLSASTTLLRATDITANEPLIYMPADRVRLASHFHWTENDATTDLFSEIALTGVHRQERVPQGVDYVEPPPGYFLVDVSSGAEFDFLAQRFKITVGLTNLFNIRYRDYLSRYRYFAHDAGRNIVMRMTVPF
ncbi:MAG TPA: TonB-dependent receptor [Patescibacteria group bacterium]|nr:TonB-dependent receptor [Patescibacteria group bacterium]